MAAAKKVLLVFGTRPETIKMAPVWMALKAQPERFDVKLAVTAQHRSMLDQAMRDFGLTPEFDLDVMRDNQDLFHITQRSLEGLRGVLDQFQPDCVLVQGDTTTTFVGALAAFYRRIAIGHVEAGLRTWQKYSPYPEEINRRLTGCMADLHFAPTGLSRDNLLAERINADTIHVTGNTGIDALMWILANRPPQFDRVLPERAQEAIEQKFILVTTHRRESFGAPLLESLGAIEEIAAKYADRHIVFPVHPNPNVKNIVHQRLGAKTNVHLIEPLDYVNFSHLMNRAEIILTDSGGVQEEAPSLSKPVLVMRETTERPEGVEAGVAKLVGTNRARIVDEVTRLIEDAAYRGSMTGIANPYGDGKAATRIADILASHLSQRVA
ncbi:MAG: UDP-N-acetylglucosamine 2-epimerase (non-hydrolyzing) [Betaproteobacteria bacterium]|nr:UDP-N-acetylglucosamine 2-epimerase (non-hydrolyzing) [Betaproteobacteria bacterium]